MPEMEVTVKALEPAAGLSVRATVPIDPGIADVIGDTIGGVFANGMQLTGAPVVIYHDIEFAPDDVDVEVFCRVGSGCR